MDYLIDPFRTMSQWAGMAYAAYPGACQGVMTVIACITLWIAFLAFAHHLSK